MISRKYIKKSNNKVHVIVKLFFLITIVLIITFEIFVSPIIEKGSEYQGRMIVTKLLAETINEVLSDSELSSETMLNVIRDKEGEILSIETNTNMINQIKAQVTTDVAESFNALSNQSYTMPLGTLLGNDFIVGRGPDIKISVTSMGYLDTQILSEFTSAGINQTNYKMMLNLTLHYTTIIPLHRTPTKLETNFVLIDTIVVGDVPQYYTNLESSNHNQQLDNRMIYPQSLE